ncbi:MAG: hypothetical protein OQK78_01130 [Gammaproteobacteria bacterium]|nr:hypothetical protein [Gammaproteobacteria bacterium]
MFATHPRSIASKQRGASLIAAVFLITGLAVMGAILTKVMTTTSRETISEWYSAQALYAAESGVDWAAYHITNNNSCPAGYPYSSPQVIEVAPGSAWVDVNITCIQAGENPNIMTLYLVTSDGMAGGTSANPEVKRRLTVQYIP